MVETKKSHLMHLLIVVVNINLLLTTFIVYNTYHSIPRLNSVINFFFFAWCGSLFIISDLFWQGRVKWPMGTILLFVVYVLCGVFNQLVIFFDLILLYLWSLFFVYFVYKIYLLNTLNVNFIYEVIICFFMPLFVYLFGFLLHFTGYYFPVVWDQYLLAMEGALGGFPSLMMGKMYQSFPFLIKTTVDFIYLALPYVFFIIYRERKMQTQQIPFDLLLEFVTIAIVGVLLYGLVPGCGTEAAFSGRWPDVSPLSFLQEGPQWITCPASFPRNCVPSLHMAWMLCMVRRGLLCNTHIKCLMGIFFIGTIVGVFGLGAHYLVDIVVGLCFANIMGGSFSWRLHASSARIQAIVGGAVMMIGWYLFIFFGLTLFESSVILTRIIFILSAALSLWIEYVLIKALSAVEKEILTSSVNQFTLETETPPSRDRQGAEKW